MKEDLLLDNINKLKEYKMNDKSLEYIYKNKNGLYKDFVNLFGAKEFERCQYSNLLKPCVRSNGNKSWEITKDAYDLYIVLHPELKHKSFFTKLQEFFEDMIFFNSNKKEYLKNEKQKEKYFNSKNK